MNDNQVIPEAAATPVSTGCPDCGSHGSCACPGWIAVDNLAHADLKALLATDNLSIGAP